MPNKATSRREAHYSQVVLLEIDAVRHALPGAVVDACRRGRKRLQVDVARNEVGGDELGFRPGERLRDGPETTAGSKLRLLADNIPRVSARARHGVGMFMWALWEAHGAPLPHRLITHVKHSGGGVAVLIKVDESVASAGNVVHGLVQSGLQVEHRALPSDLVHRAHFSIVVEEDALRSDGAGRASKVVPSGNSGGLGHAGSAWGRASAASRDNAADTQNGAPGALRLRNVRSSRWQARRGCERGNVVQSARAPPQVVKGRGRGSDRHRRSPFLRGARGRNW